MADRLLFLGTGNSESLDNFNSNLLIMSARQRMLVDCGWTIKPALRNIGLSIADIDTIFITHVHGDHIFGLEQLGFELRYKCNRKPTLILEEGIYDELWTHCLKGSMGKSSSGENSLEDFFKIRHVDEHAFTVDNLSFETFKTHHEPNKPSYGLVINNDIVFSSDTKAVASVSRRKARLYIHDVTTQEGNPAHAGLEELVKAYPRSVREKMLLTHYDDDIYSYLEYVQTNFMGLAATGQVIDL